MIAAKEYDPQEVKRAYNRRSWIYSKTVVRVEWPYHVQAIEMAKVQLGDKILEVAVGPGLTFLELARRVGNDVLIYGVDLSTGMLDLTTKHLEVHGFSNFCLKEADSRQLPFDDNFFDVLYNGYMLDLIPTQEMPSILAEFKRVLRPGGRLVLLSMSKRDEALTFREVIYKYMPAKLALYLVGGCRPVLMEGPVKATGFRDVTRRFVGGRAPSEIVLATKPFGKDDGRPS